MSREATYEERATWGECPVCHRPHGEPCDPDVGLHLGVTASGRPAEGGAHLARIQAAPRRVALVAADGKGDAP